MGPDVVQGEKQHSEMVSQLLPLDQPRDVSPGVVCVCGGGLEAHLPHC